jgi:probable F420-dependent oxidoreductase
MLWGIVGASSDQFGSLELAVALARLAEEAGFESLWAGDHVVMPATYRSAYPFSDSGKFKHMGTWRPEATSSDDVPVSDPLIHLSFLASQTTRLKFGTGVIILPQRNPLVLAKQAASFDHLSDGRLLLGLGVGWLREEFDAVGVPWEERGRRADEYIQVMRGLWSQHTVEYHGQFTDFQPVRCDPHPANGTSIPIHIGGHNDAAARRAGRIGDGFFPAIYPNSAVASRLPTLIETMKAAAREAGRDPDSIEITSGGARTAEAAKWYVDLGVHRLVIQPRSRDYDSLRDELMRFAENVIQRVP